MKRSITCGTNLICRVSALSLFAIALAGCGPEIARNELGEVIFEVPEFPEQDQYTLPDLESTAAPRTIETPGVRPATGDQS